VAVGARCECYIVNADTGGGSVSAAMVRGVSEEKRYCHSVATDEKRLAKYKQDT